MTETKFIRKGKVIRSIEKNDDGSPVTQKEYSSVNKAKRESRAIQIKEDGALGRGSVMSD